MIIFPGGHERRAINAANGDAQEHHELRLKFDGADLRNESSRAIRLLVHRTIAMCLVLTACTGAGPVVLGYPSWRARSWIFGIQQLDSSASLQLTAPSEGDPVLLLLNYEKARLHAVGYDVPLEALGLTPGPIEAAAPCERSCELTRSARAFELQFDVSHTNGWAEVAKVDSLVLDALVPDRSDRCIEGCMVVTATEARLPSIADTAYLLPERAHPSLEGQYESGLLGLVDGTMYRVGGPGSLERLCEPAGMSITAADVDPIHGRVWIATTGQIGYIELSAIERERPCPFVASSSAAGRIVHLALSMNNPAESMLVLSSTGVLGRVEAGHYRSLGALALRTGQAHTNDGFLVDLGDSAYASIGGDDIGVLRGEELNHETGFSLGPKSTQALGAMPYGNRLYFSMLSYNLFVGNDGRIQPLDEGPSRQTTTWDEPYSLAVLQGRIVVSLDKGLFGEWSSHNHYCQPSARLAGDSARHTLNIKGTVFWGDADDSDGVTARQVYWIVPQRSERCGG